MCQHRRRHQIHQVRQRKEKQGTFESGASNWMQTALGDSSLCHKDQISSQASEQRFHQQKSHEKMHSAQLTCENNEFQKFSHRGFSRQISLSDSHCFVPKLHVISLDCLLQEKIAVLSRLDSSSVRHVDCVRASRRPHLDRDAGHLMRSLNRFKHHDSDLAAQDFFQSPRIFSHREIRWKNSIPVKLAQRFFFFK